MTNAEKREGLETLVRRRGVPPRSAVDALVSEIRSESKFCFPPLGRDGTPAHAIGTVVVEWEFCLPLTDVEEFHRFLRDNENFIADATEKAMKGVHYRGTYYMLHKHGARYRTIWSYDDNDALEKEWRVGLKNRKSNFYKAVRQLCAFWLRDPQASEHSFAPANLFQDIAKDGAGNAFAALMIDAAKLGRPRGAKT